MTVKITVPRTAPASTVLSLALKAFATIEGDLDVSGPWRLLYSDLKTEVVVIPGTKTPFTPEDYSKAVGKGYHQLRLYVVKDTCWEGEIVGCPVDEREILPSM